MKAEDEPPAVEWVTELALQVIPIATLRPDQLFAFRAPPGFDSEPHTILSTELVMPASVEFISSKQVRVGAAAIVWRRMVRVK
jgi:hypothetical protein